MTDGFPGRLVREVPGIRSWTLVEERPGQVVFEVSNPEDARWDRLIKVVTEVGQRVERSGEHRERLTFFDKEEPPNQ